MTYRSVTDTSDLRGFQLLWVIGPLFSASVLPSMFFGALVNQWGSNLIWGCVYGFGWCMAAFASGSIRYSLVPWIGLLWAWTMPVLFWFASGWLWTRLTERARRVVLIALGLSMFVIVPAKTMLALESAGIHLPDFSLHMATSY